MELWTLAAAALNQPSFPILSHLITTARLGLAKLGPPCGQKVFII